MTQLAIKIPTLAFLTTLALGCGAADRGAAPSPAASNNGPAAAPHSKNLKVSLAGQRGAAQPTARKIIRRGELHVTVKDYAKTRAELLATLRAAGGYVASSRVYHNVGSVSSATFVLRIPADGFARIAERVAKLGTLTHETINSEDITAQYTDLAARLKSKRRLEARLLELVAKKTDNVSSLLAVERELARVRGEVERLQGKLDMYDKLVAMATLTVRLDVDRIYVAPRPATLGDQAQTALSRSWDSLAAVGRGAVLALVALLPWLLPLGGITAGTVVLVQRRRRRLRAQMPTRKPCDDTQPGSIQPKNPPMP
ncbi:MAG: DUF4349 domain-containing protein [Myxococcales bacterium]|nr:DUF4349 domain-containing protein [Myxococcales bacterium]